MKKVTILLFAAILLFAGYTRANYVQNQPYQIIQPDGTVIDCFVSGDEYFNWIHDANGYTIIQAPDGFYYYGITDKGIVVPSLFKVNSVDAELAGLPKWARISKDEYAKRKSYFEKETGSNSTRAPHLGTMNNIVVYIKFSDDTEFTTTRQTYDDIFNLTPGTSLKSYFNEVSYTQFSINSSHYPDCAMTTNYSYTDTHARSYFQPYNATTNPNGYNGDTERRLREHALLRDAVNWINANSPVPTSLNIDGDNDNLVDNVCFIVRGGNGAWASLLWAHRWVLYSYNVYINGKQVWDYTFQPETQVNVTTLCHEMFHALGSPDLYHYDDGGLNIAPVASWDLMESGSGHMGAYMKWKYTGNSWISSIPEITSSGTYTLNPLTSSTNNCYKIASPNTPDEYFIVEYRKTVSGTFESGLPGSGLIVYRIEPALNGNASGPPDEVYIYRPNGTTTTNGSPSSAYFSAGSGRTAINDGTNPSSFLQDGSPGGLSIYNVTAANNTISFTVGISTVANPSTFSATPVSENEIDLGWLKNPSNDNVLLVSSTSSTIGIPVNGTAYTEGETLPGGGTVIYNGNATVFQHLNLNASTMYYYKLWSYDGVTNYSTGLSAQASTNCGSTDLPFTESFNGNEIPVCWSQQVEGNGTNPSWAFQASNNAGGSAGEMVSTWQQINPATTRLILPPVNTTGVAGLSLSFRHFLDAYASGATLSVQSSADGVNWTNETWSLATTSSNVGPALVNTTITHNLNLPLTYIAFVVQGDLYQYDYWFIDDVNVVATGYISYTVTTIVNPAGAGTTNGGGTFDYGTQVTVNATANQGFEFIDWTENGTSVSSSPSYSFTLTGNRSLQAEFSLIQYQVSLETYPAEGGSVSGGGTFGAGSQITVSAVPNTGYEFEAWSENGAVVSTNPDYTFVVNNNLLLTAQFAQVTFLLSTSAMPTQGGTTTGDGTYNYGSSVTAEATATSGWSFINWTENGTEVSVNQSYTFNILSDRTLEANFEEVIMQYSIETNSNPSVGGSTSGGGIYNSGDQVTVEATPANNWVFQQWTENGSTVSWSAAYTFSAQSNRSLIANFAQQFNISTQASPPAGGAVTGSGLYIEGETAIVEATENPGYAFVDWTENGQTVSTSPSYAFAVSGNRDLTANFFYQVGVTATEKLKWQFYPNPSTGLINIIGPGNDPVEIRSLTVQSVTGKIVWKKLQFVSNEKTVINLQNQPDGVYFIQLIVADGQNVARKIVLRK